MNNNLTKKYFLLYKRYFFNVEYLTLTQTYRRVSVNCTEKYVPDEIAVNLTLSFNVR